MNRTVFLFLLITMLSSCRPQPICYYVDATRGNDNSSGTSPETAWKTLAKVNALTLNAGEKVLLKRGETFNGVLEITGRGSYKNRIYIDAYGEGEHKPRISGLDTSMYAVRIYNSDYVTLRNLEIINTGRERLARRTGVKIVCENYGVSHNIVLDSLYIHDVNGSLVKSKGGGSAIFVENTGKDIVSIFDSLTIQNCAIRRCERNAMIWAEGRGSYLNRTNWHPSTHTVVRNNLIEEVPGDGIVPIGCDGTLIEYNVMRNCPDLLPETEAAAGIWPWSCDNTLIQFNEVSNHKAPWDAQGFDSDYNCTGTIIQYNYSHDNYGGLVLICNAGRTPYPQNIGNTGTIVRYNISINDGVRPKPTHTGKMFSPAIHIAGPVKNILIERNILHLNKKSDPSIDRTMIESDSWDGYADSTVIRENIFYAPEESSFNMSASTRNQFQGNYYLGSYKSIPTDNDARLTSKVYQKEIVEDGRHGFSGLSSLMNSRNVADGHGFFVSKEAIEAFFNANSKPLSTK